MSGSELPSREELIALVGRQSRLIEELRAEVGRGATGVGWTVRRKGLVLADHAERPLTAADIGALRMPDADLAFLSACETARTGPALSDEFLHLGSVLHVAGYRHVVATLWAVSDHPALLLSRSVHSELAEYGDPARLAAAVHAAVRMLRRRYPGHPSAWAGYLHLGP